MKKRIEAIIPNGVCPHCPECQSPSEYDFEKKKWKCLNIIGDCGIEFEQEDDWGRFQVWKKE